MEETELSWERKREIASEYVNTQFHLMEKHGCLSAVTTSEYDRIVDAIAKLVIHEAAPMTTQASPEPCRCGHLKGVHWHRRRGADICIEECGDLGCDCQGYFPKISPTPTREQRLEDALREGVRLVRADRESLVESHTMPFGDLKTLDEDAKDFVAAYDAFLAAARAALKEPKL